MKKLKKTEIVFLMFLIVIFLLNVKVSYASGCSLSLGETNFYNPSTKQWKLSIVAKDCGESYVGIISKEDIAAKTGTEPEYDFELTVNGDMYYQWAFLDDSKPISNIVYLKGPKSTCTLLGLGTCGDKHSQDFMQSLNNIGGYVINSNAKYCVKQVGTDCYVSAIVRTPSAAKGSFTNVAKLGTATITLKSGDKQATPLYIGNNGQEGVSQSSAIHYNNKYIGTVEWLGLLMSGADDPRLRIKADGDAYPFYQGGWKPGKKDDFDQFFINVYDDYTVWQKLCTCLNNEKGWNINCAEYWLALATSIKDRENDLQYCINNLQLYSTNAVRDYSTMFVATSQQFVELPVSIIDSQNKASALIKLNPPTNIVAYPVLTFTLDVAFMAIKVNYANPKIVSLEPAKCTSGIQGDDGYLTLTVKNEGADEGGINFRTSCTNGIMYTGISFSESIPNGQTKSYNIPIDANTATKITGQCTVVVEDNKRPDLYKDEKTVTVTCDPLQICIPNSFNCVDKTLDGILDAVKCNAEGSDFVLLQKCTSGCLIDQYGSKCVETTCGNDVIDAGETCESCPADINKVKPGTCLDEKCANIKWWRFDLKIKCLVTDFLTPFKIIASIFGTLVIFLYALKFMRGKVFSKKKEDYLNFIFAGIIAILAGFLIYFYILATLTAIIIFVIIIIILLILFPTLTPLFFKGAKFIRKRRR